MKETVLIKNLGESEAGFRPGTRPRVDEGPWERNALGEADPLAAP